MIISSLLAISLLLSNQIQASEAQMPGYDLSDEDFAEYIKHNPRFVRKSAEFIYENCDILAKGIVGGTIGELLKKTIKTGPIQIVMIAGAVELAKDLYQRPPLRPGGPNQRLADVENQLMILTEEMRELRHKLGEIHYTENQVNDIHKFQGRFEEWQNEKGYSSEDYRSEREKIQRESQEARERWEQSRGTYTSDSSNTGPHKDSYHFHRDESTKEIKDTIDRIYRDSVSPRSEYVTKEKNET